MPKMNLTAEEMALIANLRKKEDENKPKKIGYLKRDLYFPKDQYMNFDSYYYTADEMEDLRWTFEDWFHYVPAETELVCYGEGKYETWYGYIEDCISGENAEWAKKNVYKIRKYDPKKDESE